MSDMQNPYQNNAAEPETKPVIRFSRKNALWLFLIAAAGLILAAFAAPGVTALLPDAHTQVRELVINLMYYLPFCALPVYISLRRKPDAVPSLRPGPIGLGAVLYVSVLAVLSVFLISDLTLLWCIPLQKLGFDVFKNALVLPAEPAMLVLCVFTSAAIPGVCEELVFRGVVLPGFENYGTRRAAMFSALLFALLHGSVTGLPGQFVLGLVLAQLVVSADSIYAGMIFHTVYNAAAILIEFLQRDIPAELSRPADIIAGIGGGEGVLWLVVELLLIGWMLRFSLNVFFMRGRLRGVRLEPERRQRLDRAELILLVAGLIMVALLYASDVRYMLI